jgi:hypothetical protein
MTEIVLQERKRLNQEIAAEFGVSNEIHPDDHIYNFLINHAGLPTDTSRINHYFTDGKKSAGQIGDIISQYLPDTERPRVFEFASGYGCVTHHFLKDQAGKRHAMRYPSSGNRFSPREDRRKCNPIRQHPRGL